MSLPLDPFALLNLPRSFNLTEGDVTAAYWSRLPQVHPDVSDASDSEDLSAALNSARDLLTNPLTRAQALVQLLAPESAQETSLPSGFLPWVMDARQEMEDELAGPDAKAAALRWTSWVQEQSHKHESNLKNLFQATPIDCKAVQQEINCLRYIDRFRNVLMGDFNPLF